MDLRRISWVVCATLFMFGLNFLYLSNNAQPQLRLIFSEIKKKEVGVPYVNWILRLNTSNMSQNDNLLLENGSNRYRLSLSEDYQEIGILLGTGIVMANVINSRGDIVAGLTVYWKTPLSSGCEFTSAGQSIIIPIN